MADSETELPAIIEETRCWVATERTRVVHDLVHRDRPPSVARRQLPNRTGSGALRSMCCVTPPKSNSSRREWP